ncbi:MAG: SusC/RagA family TonB-linked outer membrane protein [Gemmatimonadaceae bacterium]|nr:SusC/RagA family TonB-linked outer membrane protein [Gemmatimonadaceae bacterium]NUO95855.1 SusC/RagA family TonB-linked outer membrane protein [Gemmatimonadaceae bacterium]NUP56306.1 SusC/RagA family TonB-linked outer membrane protein [Gemmatimonadaceae bacterium]NUS32576.1 SusC/RagA family TonB-linked outer membrane protein [Gemmatimonadaceae bacterium]NUS46984.1 SusC/RagA family TonB-linked outer membrane protein [Gemmatimonadaceae bacterium]
MLKRTIARRRLLPVLALLCAGPVAAQSTGTAGVRGQVTDSTAQRPLAGAEVYVVSSGPTGTTRVARTNAAGQYALAGLPAGPAMVRVRLVGYAPAGQGLTLRDGETSVADFVLGQRLTQLNEVVVTGTGGAVERRAVGNVIETIKAEDVLAVAPARSVEQLIGERTPGLIVLPATGQVGTGAQLKVRGSSSLSLSNDPIIYIDGVRMDANTSRGQAQRGGAGASRLNDVSPEDIESIEVLKGPAASTLYGTEASNGVIQIITKRGRSGATNFNFTTRQGTNWLANPEGRAGILWGRVASTGEIINFNLYQHEIEQGNGPIFTNGRNSGYNLNLNGGTTANRYYMSASYDDDVGVVSYNWDRKFNGRANIDAAVGSKLQLQGSLGYIRDRIRFMQPSIEADPFSNLVWGTPLTVSGIKRGFGFTPPEEWSTIESHGDNDRTQISLTATYEPKEWWSNRLVTGLDVNSENNWLLFPRQPLGSLDPLGNQGLGQKNVQRASRNFLTLDYSSSLKYAWSDALRFTTSVGLQHYRSELSTITATAATFPAGPITTITGGTTTSGLEDYQANATVGMFVQQQLAWNNRVFLTAALRGDDNSAFGQNFKAAYYPKLSASWVISEEPWFRLPGVSDLRLRGALGVAGTQPGTFDAAQLYAPSVGAADQPGLVPSQFGNPQLKPERSREIELGFETTLLKGRADVSYTHYSRKITDEIVNAPLPPSAGFPGSQVINIGQVSGWGDELAVNARLLEGPRFAWEVGTQLSNNQNRIDDMGGTTFLTVGGGGQAQNRVGFGIADFFLYKYRSAVLDANGNVLSSMCDGGTGPSGLEMGGPDVPCSQAPRVYWGHSQPTWQAGFNTTVTLFRNLRLYGRVDGNGGHLQSDTEIRALHNQGSTEAVIRRNDPELQVYRAIEADAVGTYQAGFLRLREVSATYNLPASLANRLRASGATISAAGRNLAMLWTAAQGWNTSRDGEIYVPVAGQHVWDPEIRANGSFANGFQTILPPTASFTMTLRLNF